MRKLIPMFLGLLLLSPFVYAKPPVFETRAGAIRGYDTVAYFTESKPVKGSKDYVVEWNGSRWYFASAANRDRFKASPEKYAPQYGGYCAWAVANGYTASTDPAAWRIVNGKLYLNYSLGVQENWSKDIPGNIARADKNWPRVLE